MPGVILQQQQFMNKRIIEEGGMETSIKLVSNTNPVVETDTTGLVMYHYLGVDPETGLDITSRQVSCSVSIPGLIEVGYPVFRNGAKSDDPDLKGDRFIFTDINAKLKEFRVKETRFEDVKSV